MTKSNGLIQLLIEGFRKGEECFFEFLDERLAIFIRVSILLIISIQYIN